MTTKSEREVTHVVGLSGGKDSTAMALRLKELYPERRFAFVCTPTGDELPAMKAHWKKLGRLLGQKLTIVRGKVSLVELTKKHKMLPNWRARFCTPILKIHPYQAWLMKHLPVVSYIGIRADEPEREGAVYGEIEGLTHEFPLRTWGWGIDEVLGYLKKRGVKVPERTDCARCFYQTLYEWYLLWKKHPAIFASAVDDEDRTGHTYRSPQRDTQPTSLRGLRAKFEAGYVPKDRRKRRSSMCSVCSR